MTDARLTGVLRSTAARVPDRVAVESATGDRRLTYAELLDAVVRAAAGWPSLGVHPGDRVLLAMDGSPDWPVAFFSALEAGLVAVPIPASTPSAAVRAIVAHAGVRAALVDEGAHTIRGAVPHLRVATLGELLRAHATSSNVTDQSRVPEHETGLAVLLFTSGSTAQPRAVELTHANLLATLRSLLSLREAGDDETLLSVLPPAHVYELVAGQLAPLAAGARIVYAGPPLPNRILDALQHHGITRLHLVPALVGVIGGRRSFPQEGSELEPAGDAGDETDLRARLGPTLRTIAVGGAALDPALIAAFHAAGISVDVGYGLTEAGALVSIGRSRDCPPESVGRPLPGVTVTIGAQNEILVRGASVMRGYLGDDEGTRAALSDGWLHTGDAGRIDNSGFLYVIGRLKEAIVPATGETIYPEEIEPWYASPLVAEHCVVPSRGAAGNDVPLLVVVPAGTDGTDAEIHRAFAALRAAAPARLHVAGMVIRREPLPRTALGKIQRRLLAEMIAAPAGASGDAATAVIVRRLIAQITSRDVAPLDGDDDLVEHLGVDSLQGLQILAAVEKRFDIRLRDDELIDMRTIDRIARAVARAQRDAGVTV